MKIFSKTIFLLLCGWVLCTLEVEAQLNHEIDSTMQALNTAKADTDKAYSLVTLSKLYGQIGEHAKSKNYAEEALKFSEKINYKKGIANAYNNIGISEDHLGNYAEALRNLNAAVKISIEINDKQGIGNGYNGLAAIYSKQGNYADALKNYFISLKARQEFGDKRAIAGSYSNIGLVYSAMGNYTESLRNHFIALKIAEEGGFRRATSSSYSNIGNMYERLGNYDEALKYHFAALKLQEELGIKQGIASTYNNIGNVYDSKENYGEALKYYFMSLKMKQELGDKEAIANSYDNISGVYTKQKKYEEALKNGLAAFKIRSDIGFKEGIVASYLSLGAIYTGLKKKQEASNSLSAGLILAKEIGSKNYIAECYKNLSDLDSAFGYYNEALKHFKLFVAYKDSLLNEDNNKQIAQLKTQYETEKKDKEIALLNKDKVVKDIEIKKQVLLKNSFIGALALIIILVFLGYRTYRTRQLLKLQTLRNKIASDLHDDVGSTLSSIAIFSEVAQQQSKEVIPMLDTIGESARKMLDAMADIVWTINPENDQFEKIILRMRSFAYELLGAKKIEFEFEADDDITKLKLPMDVRRNLYLIFKEATNNMVKYSEASKASFLIHGEKNNFTMLIRDNGKGFDISREHIGNGLKNMKRRAEEIGAKLLVESELGKGTTIQLLLSLA